MKHALCLKVDESGLEAASYMQIAIGFGVMLYEIPELIQFKLNRSFMFGVIKSSYPLYIGTIIIPNS